MQGEHGRCRESETPEARHRADTYDHGVHIELTAAVERAFTTTGAGTPPWPAPRPPMAEPKEEQYSRCLDPAKYRILATRAEAWIRALVELELGDADELRASGDIWRQAPEPHELHRVIRVRPRRAGAVPLVLGFAGFDGVEDNIVITGAGEPAVVLDRAPDCGCDACDDGSASLIEALDEQIRTVVTGALLHVEAPQGPITVRTDGMSWAGQYGAGRVEKILDEARAGRSPYDVVTGAAW